MAQAVVKVEIENLKEYKKLLTEFSEQFEKLSDIAQQIRYVAGTLRLSPTDLQSENQYQVPLERTPFEDLTPKI